MFFVFIAIFSLCIFGSCKTEPNTLIASNTIDFEQINPVGNNIAFQILSDSFGFKSVILAYENKSKPTLPMPNTFAFDKTGKEKSFGSCYAALSSDLKRLVLDSLRSPPPYYIQSLNGKTSLKKRLNIHDFLQEKEIYLLDNRRLDETMLPDTDYYLFIDYFFWAIDAIGDSLIELDSMAFEYNNKITCVLIHTTKF
jgi:hypothetical protein